MRGIRHVQRCHAVGTLGLAVFPVTAKVFIPSCVGKGPNPTRGSRERTKLRPATPLGCAAFGHGEYWGRLLLRCRAGSWKYKKEQFGASGAALAVVAA